MAIKDLTDFPIAGTQFAGLEVADALLIISLTVKAP